jgi:hypothetical protein
MKLRPLNVRRLSSSVALLICASGMALAQDSQIAPGSERPMYAIVKP